MKKFAIFTTVMVVCAGAALATTLNIPKFTDTASGNAAGIAGLITVKETAGTDQTLTVIYTGLTASGPLDQTVTFALGANQQVTWTPATDNSVLESPSQAVLDAGATNPASIGNMTLPSPTGSGFQRNGSAVIQSGAANGIAGNYVQVNFNTGVAFAHVQLAG